MLAILPYVNGQSSGLDRLFSYPIGGGWGGLDRECLWAMGHKGGFSGMTGHDQTRLICTSRHPRVLYSGQRKAMGLGSPWRESPGPTAERGVMFMKAV